MNIKVIANVVINARSTLYKVGVQSPESRNLVDKLIKQIDEAKTVLAKDKRVEMADPTSEITKIQNTVLSAMNILGGIVNSLPEHYGDEDEMSLRCESAKNAVDDLHNKTRFYIDITIPRNVQQCTVAA